MQRREQVDARAAALLTLMCAVWAAGQVATKIGLAGISANWQAGLRSAGSALLVIAWARYRGAPLFRRDGTAPAGVLCGALFSLEFALLFVGLEHTTAARGVIFLYTAPFFVAIGAHLLIPGDRLTRPKVAGLSCAFCGVLLAVWSGLALPSREEMLGDLLCFLAAAAWASTTICVKTTKLATTSPEKTLLYQLGVAAIALPVLGMLFGERGVFDPTAPVIAAFLFQMIFVTFATFLAWFWLISIYPATRLSAFTFLTPVIGVILGHIMLGEQVTVLMALSLALIAAGIFLVNRPAAA